MELAKVKQMLTMNVISGNDEEVEKSLSEIENIHEVEQDLFSPPLLMAATAKKYNIVKILLEHGFSPNIKSADGMTPLMSATWEQQPKIVELLLQYGAQTNILDKDGWSALFHAATRGNNDLVKLLLQYGANPNLKDCYKKTPYVKAEEGRHVETALLLTKAHQKYPIAQAKKLLSTKDYNGLEDWILQGGILHGLDEKGQTLLHIASQRDDLAAVDLLLAYHANPSAKDKQGRTPADCTKSEQLLKLLQQPRRQANLAMAPWHDWLKQLYSYCHLPIDYSLELALKAGLSNEFSEQQAHNYLECSEDGAAIALALALDYFKIRSFTITKQSQHPLARYILACLSFDSGNREQGKRQLEVLVEEKFSPAMVTLAGILKMENGENTRILKLYQQAAQQGHRLAMLELAKAFWYGVGTIRNVDEAIKWEKEAHLHDLVDYELAQEIISYITNNKVKGGQVEFNDRLLQQERMEENSGSVVSENIRQLLEELTVMFNKPKYNLIIVKKYVKELQKYVKEPTMTNSDRKQLQELINTLNHKSKNMISIIHVKHLLKLAQNPTSLENNFKAFQKFAESKYLELELAFEKDTYEYIMEHGFESTNKYRLFDSMDDTSPCPCGSMKAFKECCYDVTPQYIAALNRAKLTDVRIVEGETTARTSFEPIFKIDMEIDGKSLLLSKIISTHPTVVDHLYLISAHERAKKIAKSKYGRLMYDMVKSVEHLTPIDFERSIEHDELLNEKERKYLIPNKTQVPSSRHNMRKTQIEAIDDYHFVIPEN